MAERWGIGLMAAIGAVAGGVSGSAASLLGGGDALVGSLAVGAGSGACIAAALCWAVREQRELPDAPSSLTPAALGATPSVAGPVDAATADNLVPLVRAIGERFGALAAGQLEAVHRIGAERPDLHASAELAEADRLARRSARTAATLLVLADPDELAPPGRDRSVADLLDAALADSAHRHRVDAGSIQPEVVRGLFAGDVAHVLAELIDNAAAASDEPVVIVGRRSIDGYVLAVVDEGVGLSDVARADANEVLTNPPALHAQLPTTLGLSVVGRLAARHGITVQLLEGATDGTIAKVRLPARLLEGGEEHRPSPLDRTMEALAAGVDTEPFEPVEPPVPFDPGATAVIELIDGEPLGDGEPIGDGEPSGLGDAAEPTAELDLAAELAEDPWPAALAASIDAADRRAEDGDGDGPGGGDGEGDSDGAGRPAVTARLGTDRPSTDRPGTDRYGNGRRGPRSRG